MRGKEELLFLFLCQVFFLFNLIDLEFTSVIILVAVQFCFTIMFLFSLNRRDYITLLPIFIVWFKYVYIGAVILEEQRFSSVVGSFEKEDLLFSSVISLLIALSIFLASMLFFRPDKRNIDFNGVNNFKVILLIYFLVTIYLYSGLSGDSVNRLISNSGKGYLHIFGYIGYLIPVVLFYKYRNCLTKSKIIYSSLVCLFGGLFFFMLGYRGGGLYPLVIYLVLLVVHSRFKAYTPLILLVFTFSLFEVNWFTGTVRAYFISMSIDGADFNFLDFYRDYKSKYLIPLAFDHVSLLSFYLNNNSVNEVVVGSYSTVLTGFTNWIPRFIYSDKGLTTGARMAMDYLPDAVGAQGRNTSLTTGLVFESIFNYGVLFASFFVFLLYSLFFKTYYFLRNRSVILDSYAFILVWLFCYSIFFDDFGGFVNKLVSVTVMIVFVSVVTKIKVVR